MTPIRAQYVKAVQIVSGVRLILEVPIEQGFEALKALGGFPPPGESWWVAVVRLGEGGEDGEVGEAARQSDNNGAADCDRLENKSDRRSPRRELTEGERCRTRAVMLCKDPKFQDWITKGTNGTRFLEPTEENAAVMLREICGIDSRSELALSIPGQEKFRYMEQRYREETGQAAERRGG